MTQIKDYSLIQLIGWAKILIKSILGRKQQYVLSFEQDNDGKWYVVLPKWPLDRSHLEMVAGSDDMLDLLDKDLHHLVKVRIFTSNKMEPDNRRIQLTRVKKSLAGGAFYTAKGLDGWNSNPHAIREKELWLCPVTLCVLGRYPRCIYVEKAG